ncbi:SDR family NAD(P)-dependent oxidoreductase [Streptomyces sp. NBC_01235]|uniref:SDR family NAD(P)-dependent oxidoreductase n=1 Tax=Streptomyces sp. NBC_01235 TaxID=2903788 RepID=UPI002E10CD11|nr:SDR family NAD(P)-dependent oxidoreductase [Streptomyces sp. NBC_01235]
MSSDHIGGTDLDGRTVVVTGAGSGLGRTTALALALRGAKVLIADADAEGAHGTVKAIGNAGGYAVAVVGDLAGQEVVDDVVATTLCAFGALDVLVHATVVVDELLTRAVLPHMLNAGGGSVVFAASAPGVADLVASLEVAYRARGIRAAAVGPTAGPGPKERAAAVVRLALDGDRSVL